ncbi:MAG: hypothetical protein AB7F65_01525 [Dehalococcoidia bacterium]
MQEVAVATWTHDPDDVTRQTVWFCAKHLQRVKKAGNKGFEHNGVHYKVGFW